VTAPAPTTSNGVAARPDLTIALPNTTGDTVTCHLNRPASRIDWGSTPPRSREIYAAAHVVVDPLRNDPQGARSAIDWDSTLSFRRHLWSLGFGVADAMDTAQRGGGLSWLDARELITRSAAEAAHLSGQLVCGAMTDQLDATSTYDLNSIVDAYLEQATHIHQSGATPVLMASRQLCHAATSAEDYLTVYTQVLNQLNTPVMLHWLGDAFDPALTGYWGSHDLDTAADTVLQIMTDHPNKIVGIKMSVLDAAREVDFRRRLPAGIAIFTGDDFNYAELIAGDDHGHSNALLGIFDAIAAPARTAFDRLDAGDTAGFHDILAPTVPLSRHLFTAPTSAYKTGVVFLAWLNGHQSHFHMVAGAQSHRSVAHLTRAFQLANSAGALTDPDLAAHRMRQWLALAGFDA